MTERRMFAVRLEPETYRRLRILAAERDTSLQALTEEALTDLLRKYERRKARRGK